MANKYVPEPQVAAAHYQGEYDTRARWSSYWLQISHVTEFLPGSVVEVGIGSGVTSTYLKSLPGATVTTVDFDPALEPDVVADIASLPFRDREFTCAVACEVLEHMPFEHAQSGLQELRRVADHAVISVPNSNRYLFQLLVLAGQRRKRILQVDLKRFFKRRQIDINTTGYGQHYWELESKGHSMERFCQAVDEAGWVVRTEYRNPDNPHHHFFVLD